MCFLYEIGCTKYVKNDTVIDNQAGLTVGTTFKLLFYWKVIDFFYLSVFCELKEVTSIEGEASANNRKAKLIFFYEFVIKGEWSGEVKKKKGIQFTFIKLKYLMI